MTLIYRGHVKKSLSIRKNRLSGRFFLLKRELPQHPYCDSPFFLFIHPHITAVLCK